MSLWSLIKSGGWIMVPLFGCSVAVCVVFIERLLAYRGWIAKNEQFLLAFSNHWLKGDREGARSLSEKSTTELFLNWDASSRRLGEAARIPLQVERKRQEIAVDLPSFLGLGHHRFLCPVYRSFRHSGGHHRVFSKYGADRFWRILLPLPRASHRLLVATAGGIVVAVIAVFFYNYFQVKVARLQFQLKLF